MPTSVNGSTRGLSMSANSQKQGIVTVLGSDMERMGAAASASLRRTLSADMSCNKWLTQNGFSSKEIFLPKTVSLYSSSSSRGEDFCEGGKEIESSERGQLDTWTSIQQDKLNQMNKTMQVVPQRAQSDVWSSIVSQKECEDTSKSVPPPYVHPLVKRSQSSLSEKSLEICTESLGSETGSDGFSSYPTSETGDAEDQDKEEEQDQQQSGSLIVHSYDAAEEDFRLAKYNYAAAIKKATPRPFPPPLPSLSHNDGASLRMRSVRQHGRLVVEAVSVPSQKNFHAERQNGRLLLTFLDNDGEQVVDSQGSNEQEIDDIDDMEEEFVESEYDQAEKEQVEDEGVEGELEVEEVETKGIEIVIEGGRNLSNANITNAHRLMIKPCVLNRNLSWSQKFNEVVKFKETVEETVKADVINATPVAQSLPPRPRTTRLIPSSTAVGSTAAAASASLNAYEYYWRPRPTSKAETQILNQFIKHQESSQLKYNQNYCNKKLIVTENDQMHNGRQQLIVLRGKNGEYLVPMSKTCKESRTSVLYWEPYCIATS